MSEGSCIRVSVLPGMNDSNEHDMNRFESHVYTFMKTLMMRLATGPTHENISFFR
jgi:hypothetical protein